MICNKSPTKILVLTVNTLKYHWYVVWIYELVRVLEHLFNGNLSPKSTFGSRCYGVRYKLDYSTVETNSQIFINVSDWSSNRRLQDTSNSRSFKNRRQEAKLENVAIVIDGEPLFVVLEFPGS
jgi:hypothetical protein